MGRWMDGKDREEGKEGERREGEERKKRKDRRGGWRKKEGRERERRDRGRGDGGGQEVRQNNMLGQRLQPSTSREAGVLGKNQQLCF